MAAESYPMFREALRLQAEACGILEAQKHGIDDLEAFFSRAEGWTIDRHTLAENVPQTAVDTLALLHNLRTVTLGILSMRDRPDVVLGYALEATTAVWSLIRRYEQLLGATREQIGLYDFNTSPARCEAAPKD